MNLRVSESLNFNYLVLMLGADNLDFQPSLDEQDLAEIHVVTKFAKDKFTIAPITVRVRALFGSLHLTILSRRLWNGTTNTFAMWLLYV
jgi:hypothetical protein